MTNGLLLSTASFATLSPSAQREVLACLGFQEIAVGAPDAVLGGEIESPQDEPVQDGPVELTVAMVRKLTHNLSEKTLNALRIIAQSDSPTFHMKDVIEGTEGASDYMDMRGVWSALTRRTRKILGDNDVDLVWWASEGIDDESGKYCDHLGTISALTYKSLRTHFGL